MQSTPELLNPKWRDKIVTDEPTIQSGNGGTWSEGVWGNGSLSVIKGISKGDVVEFFRL